MQHKLYFTYMQGLSNTQNITNIPVIPHPYNPFRLALLSPKVSAKKTNFNDKETLTVLDGSAQTDGANLF